MRTSYRSIMICSSPVISVCGFLLTASRFRSFTFFVRQNKKRLYCTVSVRTSSSHVCIVPLNSSSITSPSNRYHSSPHATFFAFTRTESTIITVSLGILRSSIIVVACALFNRSRSSFLRLRSWAKIITRQRS